MQDYIEVFRVEAKFLLRSFRNKEKDAVTRCKAVYGDRTDLSLMNMQHIIAKEYGFNDWEALIKAEKWELAEALNVSKNKGLSSPLKVWNIENGVSYNLPERRTLTPNAPRECLDFSNFKETYGDGYVSSYIHINNCDVSKVDLSKLDVSKATFDEWTV